MTILETLAPILLLLALGAALAKWKFLGPQFMADLNKLAFWIALPALMFRAVAQAGVPGEQTLLLLGVMVLTTLIVFAGTWLLGSLLRFPAESLGALVQTAYRGNLAYIGIPVLAYAFAALPAEDRPENMATALLILAPLTALFNILAVIALQGTQHTLGAAGVRLMARSIATNPLVIACAAGITFAILHIPLPLFADRTLEALGGAAVPIALLCIGGSLASLRLSGRKRGILIASLIKVAVTPAIACALSRLASLSGPELRIALVLAACPTAAAAFIMAVQMKADESLTSGAIALSTILSAGSLAVALWIS